MFLYTVNLFIFILIWFIFICIVCIAQIGGSDVSLFYDTTQDVYKKLPNWLLQVVVQMTVFELMNDLRNAAIRLQLPSSSSSSLSSSLSSPTKTALTGTVHYK